MKKVFTLGLLVCASVVFGMEKDNTSKIKLPCYKMLKEELSKAGLGKFDDQSKLSRRFGGKECNEQLLTHWISPLINTYAYNNGMADTAELRLKVLSTILAK